MIHLPPKLGDLVNTYKKAIDMMKYISSCDQEVVLLITLGSDFRLIQQHVINIGNMEYCHVDGKTLMNRIVVDKATRFIIGHNHTNGKAFFSREDCMLAANLKFICAILELHFIDSLLFPYKKDPVCMAYKHRKFWNQNWTELMENHVVQALNL